MATQRSDDGLLRVVVIVVGILVLLPLLMMLFAMPMGMMAWWGDGMAGGQTPFWGVGLMLVWLVVLLGIGYLLFRGLLGGFESGGRSDPALEELRLAYARGDLSEEEFEERRAKLEEE